MANAKPVFTRETFKFFRDLARHNEKVWMDVNRQRYQQAVVQPFRALLEATAPAVLQLDSRFETTGRKGANFSRINRDTRFAKDKTPYRPQMYLRFTATPGGGRESGHLYAGLFTDLGTAGYAIYAGSKRKESALALIAEPRVQENPKWVARQKRRLGGRYESYWYTTEKGEWTKHTGWPMKPEDWRKIRGWVVRRKLTPAAVMHASYPQDLARSFRELYPLLRFTSLPS
jgi:uncharacterized protein (TIGR02453 family)